MSWLQDRIFIKFLKNSHKFDNDDLLVIAGRCVLELNKRTDGNAMKLQIGWIDPKDVAKNQEETIE